MQVADALQLVVMSHNLLVVDYGLGHPGSVHDAYAFQGTQLAQHSAQLIHKDHWIWADSAYPTRTWCVVPFKATRTSPLSREQKPYNQYLSKVHTLFPCVPMYAIFSIRSVHVEHVFAVLKGRFQSLRELRLQIHSLKISEWQFTGCSAVSSCTT